MKEAGSPKLWFENLDLTPIHSTLWTDLHSARLNLTLYELAFCAAAAVAPAVAPGIANYISPARAR